MKILIGILRSKENEFDICIAKLKAQSYSNFEFFVIENLPNKLAHDQLYKKFMHESASCNFFLKLDADMVFTNQDSLKNMIDLFDKPSNHIMVYVNDIPSSLKIPGIQMFRSDVTWTFTNEDLNVDYPPNIGYGSSKIFTNLDLIDHMPLPSDYQLFVYGIHKALKSIQPFKKNKIINKGLVHISIINGIARNYFKNRQINLIWSLIGAMLIFKKIIPPNDYNSEFNSNLFDKISTDEQELKLIKSDAENFWSNEIQNMFYWSNLFSST
jgi:hypothetical protein